MKKIIAAILILTILLVNFTACDNSLDDEKTTTETTTEQTTEYAYNNNDNLYYYEPENPTTPVKEWGFYNLDEMDNILIEITGYNLSGDDPYVYFKSESKYYASSAIFRGLNGGYVYDYEISSAYELKKSAIVGQYNIVDNDTISLYKYGNGKNYSLIIDKRKTASSFNNFVVFEMLDNGQSEIWFIPYSLIDWDRGFVDYKDTRNIETPEELSYKLYLKNKIL